MTVSETTIKRSKPGKNLTKLCPGVKDNDQSIYVNPEVIFQRLIVLIEQMEDMTCSFKCVCVCVCVCLNLSTCWFLPAVWRLWHTWEVRINDLLLRLFLGAFAKFHHLYFWIYHISPPKTKTPTGEKTDDIILALEKMIYVDIGYKSAQLQKPTVTERC